jgi:hypothetical protein
MILDKIFGDANEKYVKNIRPIIEKINGFEKEIENFFNSASPNIDREEFLPWFWYLKKFGSPCKFTFLDHKSVQILDTNFFDLRLIFLLIYKAIKVIPKVFQNRVNEII